MTAPQPPHGAEPESPPPVLGRWSRLYAVVLGVLALTILAMGWLSVRFR